jgi:hypothetical protein
MGARKACSRESFGTNFRIEAVVETNVVDDETASSSTDAPPGDVPRLLQHGT